MTKDISATERRRLDSLKSFHIFDTLPESEFDDLTLLASQICETPIATISLIDEDRQWFKSRVGISMTETPRNIAFCDFTIKNDQLLIVPDATQDARFANNPLVTKDPNIRFYAGAPLVTSEGENLGALCVLDRQPRELKDDQKRALSALSRSIINLLEARRETVELKNAITEPAFVSEAGNDSEIEDLKRIAPKNVEDENQSFFQKYLKHYLIATLIIIITTLFKMAMESVTQIESPFLLFACAILLAAWRGGLGPGIYATLATVLIIDYYFILPRGIFFERGFGQNLRLLIYIAQGVFITLLCASRIRSENLLHFVRSQLEIRVARRTNELGQANQVLHKEIRERNILQEDLRQARDMALESARLKSDFLANMSHEIRTPMNGVIGVTGLLLDTKLDNEQKRFAEIIRNSGESLLTVINDILDFSKVEAGKLELEMLDFNLRNTIESTIELLASKAKSQNNELATLIYNDVPLLLQGDAGRIQQVLTNLIGNAVKFTKNGDIVVRVRKIEETDSQVHLKFSISDTGEGVSKELQEKLFQPFIQSDASTTRRFGGTGLGLSISRKLVEMMGGEIGVESELGKGSTFWFSVNFDKQIVLAPTTQEVKFCFNHNILRGRRVLIVDDHPINREVLVYQTRSWGMAAIEADGGAAAIDLIDESKANGLGFDLIILDLNMPDVDGLETARRIREKFESAEETEAPVMIMLSSSGVKIDADMLEKSGIELYLTKPYRQKDLFDGIYETLNSNGRRTFLQSEDDIHITSADFSDALKIEKKLDVNGKQKRLLLVEDNQVNQLVAQSLLKKFGYQVDIAANGLEAIKALNLLPYDLVLMDCQMPEMDGYEATRAIRARDWKSAAIPIIALTAHAIEGEREKCLNAGMNDYISKPIQKDALREILERWLSSEATEKENLENQANSNRHEMEKMAISELIETVQTPAVDFDILNDITDNDAEMRREIVEMYLAQTTASLDEIAHAITVNDAAKLSGIAHKTVGGSAICGMNAIVEPMRNLERLGLDGKTDEAELYLAQARQAFVYINEQCIEILRK